MPRFSLRTIAATVVIAAAPLAAASADTIDFTYTGAGLDYFDPTIVGTGTGSFTTDGNPNAGLADLTGFGFTLTLAGDAGTDIYNYSLADVTGFSATVSGGALTGITLLTDYQPGYYWPDEFFNIAGLGPNQASSGNFDVGPISIGTIATESTPVPEPAGAALLVAPLAALALRRRRRLR